MSLYQDTSHIHDPEDLLYMSIFQRNLKEGTH